MKKLIFKFVFLNMLLLGLNVEAQPIDDSDLPSPNNNQCINMNKDTEKEIKEIIDSITDFFRNLAVQHEDFDITLIKMVIDNHDDSESSDKGTLLDVKVNDCSKTYKQNPRIDTTNAETQSFASSSTDNSATNGPDYSTEDVTSAQTVTNKRVAKSTGSTEDGNTQEVTTQQTVEYSSAQAISTAQADNTESSTANYAETKSTVVSTSETASENTPQTEKKTVVQSESASSSSQDNTSNSSASSSSTTVTQTQTTTNKNNSSQNGKDLSVEVKQYAESEVAQSYYAGNPYGCGSYSYPAPNVNQPGTKSKPVLMNLNIRDKDLWDMVQKRNGNKPWLVYVQKDCGDQKIVFF